MPKQKTVIQALLTVPLCLTLAIANLSRAADSEVRTSKAGSPKEGVKAAPAAARDEGKSADKDSRTKDNRPTPVRELTLQELQEALLRVKGRGTLNIAAAPDPLYRPRASGAVGAAQMAAHRDRSAGPIRVASRTGHGETGSLAGQDNAPVDPGASRDYIRSRAAALSLGPPAEKMVHAAAAGPGTVAAPAHSRSALSHEPHWGYEGEHGPQAWARLKPEFGACATGTRQSPVHIEDHATLQGPAEPLVIRYNPSGGSVVNNGHTIQVDLLGDNTLVVRGTEYRLVQFHVHHPAEERINNKGFAMVMHLVHRSPEGKLAVLAVLLDPGPANPLISTVWTHMPLDVMDRVRLPGDIIDVNELLPQDRRYYQFMGSLTTPPCSEGVLWLVLKQPMTLSREQLRLFAQIFPMNARPVQPLNGRVVRNAE